MKIKPGAIYKPMEDEDNNCYLIEIKKFLWFHWEGKAVCISWELSQLKSKKVQIKEDLQITEEEIKQQEDFIKATMKRYDHEYKDWIRRRSRSLTKKQQLLLEYDASSQFKSKKGEPKKSLTTDSFTIGAESGKSSQSNNNNSNKNRSNNNKQQNQ